MSMRPCSRQPTPDAHTEATDPIRLGLQVSSLPPHSIPKHAADQIRQPANAYDTIVASV
jgi:hypothetical protein